MSIHIRQIIHAYVTTITCVCFTLFPTHRAVSAMVTMVAMTVADVNLVTMEIIAANHRFSLDSQSLLTLMRTGRSLLTFLKCYAHMILAILFSWRSPLLATQASHHQISLSTSCMCGYTILLPKVPLSKVRYTALQLHLATVHGKYLEGENLANCTGKSYW